MYLFHRHFLRELIGFPRLDHVVSTIDSLCFIGIFLTFVINKGTNCPNRQICRNLNLLKTEGVITERTFFHMHFLRNLLGFSRLANIIFTIESECFIGSF